MPEKTIISVSNIKDEYRGMPCTEEILNSIFEKVGSKYGFSTIEAQFSPHTDLKITWARTFTYVGFKVSDYLRDIPSECIVGLANVIFARCMGYSADYDDDIKNILIDKEFRAKSQKVYIRRSHNCKKTPMGDYKNLDEIFNSLVEKGYAKAEDKPYLSWSDHSVRSKATYCSAIMNTVIFNSALDSESVSDEVLEYILFSKLLLIKQGLARFGIGEDFDVDEEVRKFPNAENLEKQLYEMDLRSIS